MSTLKILTHSYNDLERHTLKCFNEHKRVHRHTRTLPSSMTSYTFYLRKSLLVMRLFKRKADLKHNPKDKVSSTYLCVVRRNRMRIRWKQALQKFHLPNGHISTKISGSWSLSLFIGHFDTSTYKSITENEAFKSIYTLLG